MIGGVHPGTVEHLQLGAGLFLKDFDVDSARDAAQLLRAVRQAVAEEHGVLGATLGGGTFSCVPRLRQLGADGLRSPYVGGTLCDGWQVRMTGTLLEVTPDNLAMLLAFGDVQRQGSTITVTARAAVREEDHLSSLCWIGEWGSGYVLIELLGALNMNGAALTFRDKGEGTMPFCFQAHALSPEDQDEAPFRVVFFEGGEAV